MCFNLLYGLTVISSDPIISGFLAISSHPNSEPTPKEDGEMESVEMDRKFKHTNLKTTHGASER